MAVSREEFEQYVWPSLPASQPGSGLTSEWVYNQSLLRSLGGFEKVMGWHAGREYGFRDIRIDGGVKQYQGFTIHDDPVLSITDERGKAREIQLFGSIIERDGEFKIYSFNLD
ncbi:MAG TPA: hypothetical protein VLV83_16815 [Acidobacteriota bacterium]|nr:hypothetical protein [Acidobacteriota bacterium]